METVSPTLEIFSKQLLGLIPKNPYWQGRFSNGPVWSEYLAYSLNIKLDNQAYSGSPTSYSKLFAHKLGIGNKIYFGIRKILSPGGVKQSKKYFKSKHDYSKNIYAIYLGYINYLNLADKKRNKAALKEGGREQFLPFIQLAVHDIKTMIESIYNKGGRTFIVANLADMSQIPDNYVQFHLSKELLGYLSYQHNALLVQSIEVLKRRLSDLKIVFVNTSKILNEIKKETSIYQLENTDKACYIGSWFKKKKKNS